MSERTEEKAQQVVENGKKWNLRRSAKNGPKLDKDTCFDTGTSWKMLNAMFCASKQGYAFENTSLEAGRAATKHQTLSSSSQMEN